MQKIRQDRQCERMHTSSRRWGRPSHSSGNAASWAKRGQVIPAQAQQVLQARATGISRSYSNHHQPEKHAAQLEPSSCSWVLAGACSDATTPSQHSSSSCITGQLTDPLPSRAKMHTCNQPRPAHAPEKNQLVPAHAEGIVTCPYAGLCCPKHPVQDQLPVHSEHSDLRNPRHPCHYYSPTPHLHMPVAVGRERQHV